MLQAVTLSWSKRSSSQYAIGEGTPSPWRLHNDFKQLLRYGEVNNLQGDAEGAKGLSKVHWLRNMWKCQHHRHPSLSSYIHMTIWIPPGLRQWRWWRSQNCRVSKNISLPSPLQLGVGVTYSWISGVINEANLTVLFSQGFSLLAQLPFNRVSS